MRIAPFALAGLLVLAMAACGPDRRMIRSAVVGERFVDAEKDLNELYDRHLAEFGADTADDGPAKHALLWRFERGTVDFIGREYARSLDHFRAAARHGRDLRTASASRVTASYLLNDTVRTYIGEPFEHTYVPYYGMLAALFLGQQMDGTWSPPPVPGAAPEPQGDNARTWYDRAASGAIALEDALRAAAEGDWGESKYTDNAFLHLMAAATRHATAALPDDRQSAALYARRAWDAYKAQGPVPTPARLLLPRIVAAADRAGAREMAGGDPDPLPSEQHGTVLVVEEVGFVPKREEMRVMAVAGAPPGPAYNLGGVFVWVDGPYQEEFRDNWAVVPLPGEFVRKLAGGAVGIFGFELPVLPLDRPRGAFGRADAVALEPVDDVRRHARICFDDHKAKRLTTTLIRVIGKLVATRVAAGAGAHAATNDAGTQRLLTDVLWAISSAGVTWSEQADTRCWTLLPDRIAAAIDLPAGEHRLTVTRADGVALPLGVVRVRPGRLSIVHARSFPAGVDHLGPED